jgi:amino acid permease
MSESCLSKFLLIRRIGRFSPAVWITMCLIVASAINLAGTRAYGEMEFWFAIVKGKRIYMCFRDYRINFNMFFMFKS